MTIKRKLIKGVTLLAGTFSSIYALSDDPEWPDAYDHTLQSNYEENNCVSNVEAQFSELSPGSMSPLAVKAVISGSGLPNFDNTNGHMQGMTRRPDPTASNINETNFYFTRSGINDTNKEGGIFLVRVNNHFDYDYDDMFNALRSNLTGPDKAKETAIPAGDSLLTTDDAFILTHSEKDDYCPDSGNDDCDLCAHFDGSQATRNFLMVGASQCKENDGDSAGGMFFLFGLDSDGELTTIANNRSGTYNSSGFTPDDTVAATGMIVDGTVSSTDSTKRFLVMTVGMVDSGDAEGFDSLRLYHMDENGNLLGEVNMLDAINLEGWGQRNGKGMNNISLIRECSTNEVYALMFRKNTSDEEKVHLYKVLPPVLDADGTIVENSTWPGVEAIAQHVMNCYSGGSNNQYCHNNSMATAYASNDNYLLSYSGMKDLDDQDGVHNALRFAEFAVPNITAHSEAWVTFFKNTNYLGNTYTLTKSTYEEDGGNAHFEDLPMNNTISSFKAFLPSGCNLVIYKNGNLGGDSKTYNGTGAILAVSSMPSGWNDEISSMEFTGTCSGT